MPALKVRIPKVDLPHYEGGKLATVVKTRLAEAIESLAGAPAPISLPNSIPSETVTIWISDAQHKAITALSGTHKLPGAGPTANALLHAIARAALGSMPDTGANLQTGAKTTLDQINEALGNTTRPDQARFFAELAEEIMSPRPAHEVAFAEASTGVGKSRAFLALALDWSAQNPDEHVVIAAPSYSVLLQLIDQWQRIASVHEVPAWEVLVGQQEFVSQHALERILNETPDLDGAAAALAWFADGGRPAADDPVGHRWLMRSLRIATGFAFTNENEVVLDGDVGEDDAGMLAYRAQFKNASEAPVIFCTHAMLAVDVRLRSSQAARTFAADKKDSVGEAAWAAWEKLAKEDRQGSASWEVRNELLRTMAESDAGRLPPIGLLIVDEAHLLEQSFATVFASGASMARLMRDLRTLHADMPKAVPARDIARMEELWGSLREIGSAVGGERVMTTNNQALRESVEGVRQLVAGVVGRLKGKQVSRPEARHLRSIQLALEVAARAVGERSGMATRVSWSPTVQWPSIEVGRYDVSRELDFLWALMVRCRSVLVSATLYEDVSAAGLESMRRVLSVRTKLMRPLIPVRPQWLFDPVTLHLASDAVHADGTPRFRRPTQRDKLDPIIFKERTDRWRMDVADYIAMAYTSAAGGVLVLLTSHAEREEILSRIRQEIPADCLLTQGGDRSLDALRHAFLELSAEGKKPLLLAVGAAWTGLDLSGDGLTALTGEAVPASADNVLTDLIIPTAPIGTNRSLTHEWRRERMGMIADIGATSIMFRQGLGRLVRREGIPNNRRIHFLDARIHEPAWNALLHPVVRALTRYTNRRNV